MTKTAKDRPAARSAPQAARIRDTDAHPRRQLPPEGGTGQGRAGPGLRGCGALRVPTHRARRRASGTRRREPAEAVGSARFPRSAAGLRGGGRGRSGSAEPPRQRTPRDAARSAGAGAVRGLPSTRRPRGRAPSRLRAPVPRRRRAGEAGITPVPSSRRLPRPAGRHFVFRHFLAARKGPSGPRAPPARPARAPRHNEPPRLAGASDPPAGLGRGPTASFGPRSRRLRSPVRVPAPGGLSAGCARVSGGGRGGRPRPAGLRRRRRGLAFGSARAGPAPITGRAGRRGASARGLLPSPRRPLAAGLAAAAARHCAPQRAPRAEQAHPPRRGRCPRSARAAERACARRGERGGGPGGPSARLGPGEPPRSRSPAARAPYALAAGGGIRHRGARRCGTGRDGGSVPGVTARPYHTTVRGKKHDFLSPTLTAASCAKERLFSPETREGQPNF